MLGHSCVSPFPSCTNQDLIEVESNSFQVSFPWKKQIFWGIIVGEHLFQIGSWIFIFMHCDRTSKFNVLLWIRQMELFYCNLKWYFSPWSTCNRRNYWKLISQWHWRCRVMLSNANSVGLKRVGTRFEFSRSTLYFFAFILWGSIVAFQILFWLLCFQHILSTAPSKRSCGSISKFQNFYFEKYWRIWNSILVLTFCKNSIKLLCALVSEEHIKFPFINTEYPAGNYMFKVNNRNTRTRCEICSKVTIKILDAIGVVLVSLLLTLNMFYTLL